MCRCAYTSIDVGTLACQRTVAYGCGGQSQHCSCCFLLVGAIFGRNVQGHLCLGGPLGLGLYAKIYEALLWNRT